MTEEVIIEKKINKYKYFKYSFVAKDVYSIKKPHKEVCRFGSSNNDNLRVCAHFCVAVCVYL